MSTLLCILFWIITPAIAVLALINWALETRQDRVIRWHKSGISQVAISKRLGVSRYQVRKLLA